MDILSNDARINRIETWRDICDNYLRAFAKKHDYDIEYEIQHNYVWIGNDIGSVACIGDMYIGFDDIRYDIDHEIPEDKFDDWYWKSLDRAERGLKFMNYPSFCKGAPDPISPEKEAELHALHDKVVEAKKALEDAMKDYRDKDLNFDWLL